MTTGQKIRKARTDAGLSQQQLGHVIGMYVQTVSKIENDRFCPNHDTLMRIAMATGKPPEFFGWQHADPETANLTELTPGQIVTLYRTHGNITQKQLAELVGTYGYVIREWESGVKLPKNDVIEKVATYFGIDPSLIGHPERPDTGDSVYEARTDLLIKRARLSKGLTQTELAKRIGISKQNLNQWGTRPVKIPLELAGKLSTELDVPEDLLRRDETAAFIRKVVKYLRHCRIRRNLTQKELASLSGVSTAQISRMERTGYAPALDIAKKLHAALDMDFAALDALPDDEVIKGGMAYLESDTRMPDGTDPADGLSLTERRLLVLIRGLSEREQTKLLRRLKNNAERRKGETA